MDIINKQDYSNSGFYTQLLLLKMFRGDKTQFVCLPYYDRQEGRDVLYISKQIWSKYKNGTNSPGVMDLVLIAGYFKVKIEYFFIKNGQPEDYITDEYLIENNKFAGYNDAAKQKYSLDCFHIQLKKLRLFKGFKKQIAAVRYFKIPRLIWLKLERGDHRPDLDKLVLFSNCFKVRIEYFLIPDGKPEDYMIKDDLGKDEITPLYQKANVSQIYTVENFHIQLKKLRRFYNYQNQFEIYTLLDIVKQIWWKWESGKSKPNLDNLFLISGYLNVRVEYFFITDAEPEDFINNESIISAIKLLDTAKKKTEQLYSKDDFHIQLNKLKMFRGFVTRSKVVCELNITIYIWALWLKNKRSPDFMKIAELANLYKVRVEYFFIKNAKPEDFINDQRRGKEAGTRRNYTN